MEHPKDATRQKPVHSAEADNTQRALIFYKNFIAGGVAGAVSRTVVSPLERAKILFQVQTVIDREASSPVCSYPGAK